MVLVQSRIVETSHSVWQTTQHGTSREEHQSAFRERLCFIPNSAMLFRWQAADVVGLRLVELERVKRIRTAK